MTTIRLQIAYEGTAYHGWQVQSRDRSVEGELTRSVARILGRNKPVKVQGASRTDSGVHARGQVAHFRHATDRSRWDFCRGLNALTDDDICVLRVEEASDEFHARHSARGKVYRYRVWNHRFAHPFWRRRSWQVGQSLDMDAMRCAAQLMVGEHDFAGFRSIRCSSPTTVRRMDRVEVVVDQAPMVEIIVEGEAFLQYMVRIMAGTLVDVGRGTVDEDDVRRALTEGDRDAGGMTAPAHGLTLETVHYPDFPWRGSQPRIGGDYLVGDVPSR